MSRWLRQHVTRENVDLILYEYVRSAKLTDLKVVSRAKTDKNGNFDFGDLRTGYYTLRIEDPVGNEDFYDVQVVPLKRKDDYLVSSGFSCKLLKRNGLGNEAGFEEPW